MEEVRLFLLDHLNSVISSNDDLRVSLSKYFLENNLKLSASYMQTKDIEDKSSSLISVLMQLRL